MEDFTTKLRDIGSVIADDVSPSFDVFRFKANANEYVYPGTLVGTTINNRAFLIGRISGSIEVNPHESAPRAKVREAMGIEADYPEEELSTNIYRLYEADIIEEGIVSVEGEGHQLEITEPSDMAKAGEPVFIPSEEVIAKAMGFEREAHKALCLRRTRITPPRPWPLCCRNYPITAVTSWKNCSEYIFQIWPCLLYTSDAADE